MNFAIDCLFIALLAALTRYFLALSQACLLVGRAISDTTSRTGLQDAVTPPWVTNAALIVWLLSAILVGSQFWYRGFWHGLASVTLFFGVMTIVGIGAMPKQTSSYWVKLIHGSLLKRGKEFAKRGDEPRASAATALAERIQDRLGERLV